MVQDLTPHEQLMKKGYVVFRSALSAEEVTSLRSAVHDYFKGQGRFSDFGKTQPDAFAKVPEIQWVVSHPKILAAVREAAGRDDIVYTFHSDIHMNVLGNWHTDTQAYFTPNEVLVDDFCVYKVGIYLQDHLDNSQGLTVCEGTHRTGQLNGTSTPITSRAGDIIVFDVRILHHGDMKNMLEKVVGKVVKSNTMKYSFNTRMRKLLGRNDKLSLFFTFGVPNSNTKEFSTRNMRRQNKQNGTEQGIEFDTQMQNQLEAAGVQTVKL